MSDRTERVWFEGLAGDRWRHGSICRAMSLSPLTVCACLTCVGWGRWGWPPVENGISMWRSRQHSRCKSMPSLAASVATSTRTLVTSGVVVELLDGAVPCPGIHAAVDELDSSVDQPAPGTHHSCSAKPRRLWSPRRMATTAVSESSRKKTLSSSAPDGGAL